MFNPSESLPKHLADLLYGVREQRTAISHAYNSVVFPSNPLPGDTVTIAGTVVTFVAGPATGNQVTIAKDAESTVYAFLLFLKASADTNLAKVSYSILASSLLGIAMSAVAPGTAGNALTLAASVAKVGGATFAGGASNAAAITFGHYKTGFITSGSGGAEPATIGVTPGVMIGFRKLIALDAETNIADTVTLDFASFSYGTKTVSAVVLTNVGDFALCEWRGQKWELIAASAGVVSAA